MTAVEPSVSAYLKGLPDPLFAVVDGAFFDNIISAADKVGLRAKPLYMNELTAIAGPHVIALDGSQAVEAVVALVGEKPTGVFWSWPGDCDSLWSHLRRNSMMEIPLATEEGFETVVFRHADANVLAWVLRLPDEEQYARFVGSATRVVMRATDPPEIHVFPEADRAKTNLSKSRYIRLSAEQMGTLSNHCIERSRLRVMRALRRGAPAETSMYSDKKLREIILASEHQGYEIGIRTEKAQARWAYLNLLTRGQIIKQPGVLEYMQDGKARPDRKVDLMLKSIGIGARSAQTSSGS